MNGPFIEELGADWRDQLFGMLNRQLAVSNALMDQCRKQSGFLKAEKAGSLLLVLQEREGLLEELNGLALALEPYRSAWPEIWNVLSGAEREEVQQAVQEIQEVVDDVTIRDADDQQLLEQEKSRLQNELESMNTARDSQRAYGRPVHRGIEPIVNRFADEQG